MAAAAALLVIVAGALFAPWVAPHDPFDLASVSLLDARNPPAWIAGGSWAYPLGSDNLGRDVFSTILYGSRISLRGGFASIGLARGLGGALGLFAGHVGGPTNAIIMRIAHIHLNFPPTLIAFLAAARMRGIV